MSYKLMCFFLNIIEKKQAKNVITINIKKISSIADYLIICCGKTSIHIKAILESIRRETKQQHKIYPKSIDGKSISNNWVILDYSSIIIHIFDEETRKKYNIENLWENYKLIE